MKGFFTFILAILLTSQLYAQSESAINGIVTDSNKGILPGAAVHLKKTGGSEQITYTNAEGKFDFSNLSRGTYEVSTELDGFQTITAEITLEDASVRAVQIVLPEAGKVNEEVTVSAESDKLLQKDETQGKQEIGTEVINYAPIAQQRFQDALPLIPSVVRGPDGLMNINGARATESTLLVNGSNVTDPVTGNFAIELPIEAVENVQVFTNPYSAEYGKFSGGVTSVSTRSGEDHLKVELNDFFPRFHFEDGGLNGLEAFTPRLRVSGPTSIKNLYFSQAIQYKLNRTYLKDLPQDANRIQLEGVDSITQLDYRPSSTHQMSMTISAFPEKVTNANLNTFLPEASTPDLKQRGYNIGLFDRYFFNNGSFLENSLSYKTYDVSVLPKGDLSEAFEIGLEGDSGSYFNYQDRNSSRIQWTTAYTFRPAEAHSFRAGVDIAHTDYSGLVSYAPVEVLGLDNQLLERTDFIGDGTIGHSNDEISSYIEDHWNPLNGLALDAGLRMDYDSLSGNPNFGPRLSASYSPASLPRTVFKSGFGIFYDKIYLNTADFENYPSRLITDYDTDGNVTSSTLVVNRFANKVKAPKSITWNAEIDQQVSKNVLVRSNFLTRHGTNQFLVAPAGNELLLSNDGKSRYWEWELTTQVRLNEDSKIYASYIRSKTKGNLNDFDTYFGNFQSPIVREDAYANLPFDAPNRFLFWGIVQVPGKVYVSPLLEIRDGFPYSPINAAQQYVGERNELRFPRFTQLDMRVTRTFTLGKYKVTAGMKVYNILNTFNPRDVQNNLNSPAFGTFYNSVGRTFRGAFEIQY